MVRLRNVFFLMVLACAFFAPSAQAVLPDACLNELVALSKLGGGWIKQKDLADSLLRNGVLGQTVTFYKNYTCTSCGREDSMKPNTSDGHTVCVGCGHPHDGEPTFEKTVDGEPVVHIDDIIKDPTKEKAARELRWKCANCGNMVPSNLTACPGCGGKKAVGSEHRIESAGMSEVKQPDGRNDLPEVPLITQRREQERTGANPVRHERAPEPEPEKGFPWGITAASAGGLGAVGLGLYWLFRAHPNAGQVSAMSWERWNEIQNFEPTTGSNWCSDVKTSATVMPVNGGGEHAGISNVRRTGRKQKGTVEILTGYHDWVERKAYTDYEEYMATEKIDDGSGTITYKNVKKKRPITKYRNVAHHDPEYETVPVYADWCEYDTYGWRTVRNATISGTFPEGDSLPVPTYTLGAHERALAMQSKYKVDFAYDHKGPQTYSQEPKDEESFRQWGKDMKVIVERDNLGNVHEVKRADAK